MGDGPELKYTQEQVRSWHGLAGAVGQLLCVIPPDGDRSGSRPRAQPHPLF